jgi:hypothetical protein
MMRALADPSILVTPEQTHIGSNARAMQDATFRQSNGPADSITVTLCGRT